MTLTLDLLTTRNGFPELMVAHFYVKFDDPSCIVFLRYHVEKQTTNRYVNIAENPNRWRG